MLAAHMEWVLWMTGLATAGALLVALAPVRVLGLIYGQAPSDALSLAIARHWGVLVSLVGVLLIYSAGHPEVRVATLWIALTEKLIFALGMFLSPFRRRAVVIGLASADAAMGVVYLLYLGGL